MKRLKQTKIICTIGPASKDEDVMTELVNAGMDVMRLNFSHQTHKDHLERLETIRTINKNLDTHVAVLLDTKGPEIRTHKFKDGKATIMFESEVVIYPEEILGDETKFSTTYTNLYNDLKVGNIILVDDGYLELEVTKIEDEKIYTYALNTHTLKDRRGLNLPGVKLDFEFISPKDYQDIVWGCQNNVDFIAASFTRRAQDILDIRQIMKEQNNEAIKIIAKIENTEGVENIDEILKVVDGIMIARGDLGVEVPAEDVPVIQKMIIEKCHLAGKISVTATQMLEGMIDHPRPTRAEVSDVANAIYDGTDAIMLSGESAIGKYPVEAVDTMSKIAKKIEGQLNRKFFVKRANASSVGHRDIETSIGVSVAYTVIQSKVDMVIAPTMSGNTAAVISRFRPNTTILALVPNSKVARSLMLHHAVVPKIVGFEDSMDDIINQAIIILKKEYGIQSGDRVIVTGGFPVGQKTNGMRIVDIP
jgi:pyruvate kinase